MNPPEFKTEFLRELDRLIIAPVVGAFTNYHLKDTARPLISEGDPPDPRDLRILLLATALAESGLRELQQGPTDEPSDALSFWQIEPATHLDIYNNFLQNRPVLRSVIRENTGMLIFPTDVSAPPILNRKFQSAKGGCPPHWFLVANPRYACFMARICYFRTPDLIPPWEGDIEPFARLWKAAYNTGGGKGTVEHFCEAWASRVKS